MKKISKKLQWAFTILMVFGGSAIYAQENKPDTLRLITEDVRGKETVVWDTIIIITEDNNDEVKSYLKEKHGRINIHTNHEGGAKYLVKTISAKSENMHHPITADVDLDGGLKTYTYKIKSSDTEKDQKKVKVIKKNRTNVEDGIIEIVVEASDDQDLIWVSDSGELHQKTHVWVDKPHKADHKIIVISAKDGKYDVKEMSDSLKNIVLEYVIEDEGEETEMKKYSIGILSDDGNSFTIDSINENLQIIKEIEVLTEYDENVFEMKDGNKTKEFKFKVDDDLHEIDKDVMIIAKVDKKGNRLYFSDEKSVHADIDFSMDVNDEELKKLGIRSNQKLMVEGFRVFLNEEDQLNLRFRLNESGKASVKIYDSQGNKIFSDKVKYFPGTYDKYINLKNVDKKSLYIYLGQGNASIVKKLKI